jgi:hypothetical protein
MMMMMMIDDDDDDDDNNNLVLTSQVEEGIVAMFVAPHPAKGPLQTSQPKTR